MKEETSVSLRVYALAVALGLGGCAKKPSIKPEEALRKNFYIERFQDQEDPEQLEMFRKPKGGKKHDEAKLESIVEKMKNNPSYRNEMMKKINTL